MPTVSGNHWWCFKPSFFNGCLLSCCFYVLMGWRSWKLYFLSAARSILIGLALKCFCSKGRNLLNYVSLLEFHQINRENLFIPSLSLPEKKKGNNRSRNITGNWLKWCSWFQGYFRIFFPLQSIYLHIICCKGWILYVFS